MTSKQEEIMDLVFQVGRLLRSREDFAHGSLHEKISPYQLQVLFTLAHRPSTMSELAKEMNVTLPSATALVDRLVKGGWVARNHDEDDRRIIRLTLTEEGSAICHKLKKVRMTKFKALLDVLSDEDAASLHRILLNLHTTLSNTKGV